MDKKIYVTQASMPPMEEYIELIKPLWDSHILTNMGKYHKELEHKLQQYLKVDCLSLMVNGHMALELAIQSLDLPKDGEVITTPFTFISTIHAIIRNGLKPVFCDIKLEDYTIDENKIEDLITEKTVAILPVHVYGNICNIGAIEEIAYKYNLKVIYDAAHAFGEEYMGRGVGNFGTASIFSFHATKIYNTIEGGAVCCNDKDLYEKLYDLKNFGIRSEELITSVGANAKMNEFQAAMGLCNLKYVDKEIKKRKEIVSLYEKLLSNHPKIELNPCTKDIKRNYIYMPVLFENEETRNRIYQVLREENIYARKYFYPIAADAVCFKNKYKQAPLEIARNVSKRILVLPLFSQIEKEVVAEICRIILEQV